MAETKTSTYAPDSKGNTTSAYQTEYKTDYESDWAIHRNYVTTFDPLEAMLVGQVFDSVSNSIDYSKITDSYSSTLAIERAARVVGKLPDGTTEAVAKGDQGKAAFMEILRQKWIYPNANSQHKFQTKLRLWQLYSSVYGYMPMFYDWNVASTGYIGPDCWLWSPRNLIPQQGRTSLADMEYVTALTWVGKSYLQDILDDASESQMADDELAEGDDPMEDETTEIGDGDENKAHLGGWNLEAIRELLEKVDAASTSPDLLKDTQVERTRIAQPTKKGICLATRYEAGEDGEWCTFAPDYGYVEVRRLPNPHKNARIPFVIKYSQPLFDSFYGLGDFQRAKPLQFARDGLTNFYFKGIKMNLIPPIVANANGVMKHTLDYREGSVMLETIPNSIRRLETSNAGLATYEAAATALTGSLLSLFGSQNAAAPAAATLNPSQGKTPAAIDLYNNKEADRDGQERTYLEDAIEELTDGFFSLVANIGTEDIPVNLFAEDIQDIQKAGLTDVLGLFTRKFQPNSSMTGGQLKVDPQKLKGIEFRFNIDPGSTAKQNKAAQLQQLQGLMDTLAKFQNIFKDDPRVDVNWGKMLQTAEKLSDIAGAGEFVTVKPGPSPQELEAQQQAQQQQSAGKSPAESLNYKDAPPDIQRQIEQQAGLQPSQMASNADQQTATQTVKAAHDMASQKVKTAHDIVMGRMQSAQSAVGANQSSVLEGKQSEPPEPKFAGGRAYNDPLVASAAEHLAKI